MQWSYFGKKDTVTPLARAKITTACSCVLREERQVEEGRERKELGINVSTRINDAVFEGRVRVDKTRLNDFLAMELDGRGAVDANRDVLQEEFFENPKKYICDAGVLGEMQASDRYKRMERAVREEMDMEEGVNRLYEHCMDNLLRWLVAAAEVKASDQEITKQSLDAALEEMRISIRMSAAMKLEGVYESVYNARWHHFVEVPGGEGTGLEVKEGKPEQQWTYKKVGENFERHDAVQQSGGATPVLMVLTSDKGWPYSWYMIQDSPKDFFVNCEVERVWRIVRNDLAAWLSNFDLTLNSSPVRRLLIGTPVIGKSMAAGSYLLYQLLQYDVKKPQVVCSFGDTT
ncbi:putative retrotransposon hot spot (RHS) protein [Trypanosoma cruzi Dm28c]|uniref:Putative retrotransposon hot spot (RHS) protein n=2 Tax=Trypanosoma cruzi TaxID=5693 RepID=V5B9T0_TRYCR|nr:putative retrotransposon hot spot (RHS) protein [Trypanosoma cruzi Dm28c]PWU89499.1 putative retrotransposon hot spot protein (RHS,) [Trypanosoma cruzi]